MTTLSGLGDIQWVKCYRQRTGASLREAMAALEKSKTGPHDRPLPPSSGASRRAGAKVDAPARVGVVRGRTGGAGSRKRKSKTPQGASSSNPRPASASTTIGSIRRRLNWIIRAVESPCIMPRELRSVVERDARAALEALDRLR